MGNRHSFGLDPTPREIRRRKVMAECQWRLDNAKNLLDLRRVLESTLADRQWTIDTWQGFCRELDAKCKALDLDSRNLTKGLTMPVIIQITQGLNGQEADEADVTICGGAARVMMCLDAVKDRIRKEGAH